ncbi:hypothetical protein K505DRAFT_323607 [Melanomma pulvis-pyrius CBS 109.77]|uniref:Uncharacterized protein n=1 Tax=Melanomma pulvis-pyrius CBS 109.77 TaxID=1314802 RepID=A0A6A6XI61_9PLEO|nr:hypothetical protein K505DRAFT_323607 [Melanomma pulvis-pyrius CBS 109.77]
MFQSTASIGFRACSSPSYLAEEYSYLATYCRSVTAVIIRFGTSQSRFACRTSTTPCWPFVDTRVSDTNLTDLHVGQLVVLKYGKSRPRHSMRPPCYTWHFISQEGGPSKRLPGYFWAGTRLSFEVILDLSSFVSLFSSKVYAWNNHSSNSTTTLHAHRSSRSKRLLPNYFLRLKQRLYDEFLVMSILNPCTSLLLFCFVALVSVSNPLVTQMRAARNQITEVGARHPHHQHRVLSRLLCEWGLL